MTHKYETFTFKDYVFDAETKTLTMHYGIGGDWHFTETYRFDFDFVAYDPDVLDRALQLLFFMTAVSYYKTFIPPKLVLEQGIMDAQTAQFFTTTYQEGLGEFFYVNQLDPHTPVVFESNSSPLPTLDGSPHEGILVGIGGGKDSLVSVEALRNQPKVATWSLNHRSQLEPLVKEIGLPHFWVEREWDAQLFEMRSNPDSYNGHIPISAIIACVGAVVSVLSGYRDHVVSNESSASDPTLHYKGKAVNHQYSKSLQCEQDIQALLDHHFGQSIRYYSFLRPHTELKIAEVFANSFEKYATTFSSCNQAFKHSSDHIFWCGECPKCAFVFLALTPFVPRPHVEKLWQGKNLLLAPDLVPTYRALLGIEGDKPLECVGEVRESRAAMRLAQQQYPELVSVYEFELPDDYDFRKSGPHLIPDVNLAELSLNL